MKEKNTKFLRRTFKELEEVDPLVLVNNLLHQLELDIIYYTTCLFVITVIRFRLFSLY